MEGNGRFPLFLHNYGKSTICMFGQHLQVTHGTWHFS